MSMFVKLMIVVVVLLASIMAAAYFLRNKLTYFPDKHLVGLPLQMGLEYRDANFTSADGTKLAGWIVEKQNARGWALVCHGNGGNVSYNLELLNTIAKNGFNVLIFDYRGFGNSEGTPTEEGLYADTIAAADFLMEQPGFNPHRFLIYGHSIGAAAALYCAIERRPSELILEAPFSCLADAAASHYPAFIVRPVLGRQYDNMARIGKLLCPLLIVHGMTDGVIPQSLGKKLFDEAKGDKTFASHPNGHNNAHDCSEYENAVRDFIDRFY
ncbi:MAG: alpha/beta hydrolase [Candidatus Brocadiia bacterium]